MPILNWLRATWSTLDFGGTVLGIVAFILLLVSVVTGFWHVLAQFPAYSKLIGLLGLIGLAGWLYFKRRTWWPLLRSLVTPRTDQGGGMSQTFIRADGAISGQLTATGNLMKMGFGRAPVAAIPPIPTTPELLHRRVDELRDLSRRLDAFFAERATLAAASEAGMFTHDWDAIQQSLEVRRSVEHETWRLYVERFDKEVIATYEDMRLRGFVDAELETNIDIPREMASGHPSIPSGIAQRLGVLLIKVEQRMKDEDLTTD
jgi:hypothetical protein